MPAVSVVTVGLPFLSVLTRTRYSFCHLRMLRNAGRIYLRYI